ncbi:FAM96B protein [Pleurotus eryngii]|uniref:FAM96B protein n=1 Tax=Pleurotus eryngii TaxID=5323 RepID=A0A9P6DJY8_PLEER|nr:FAM96B protein [Pleurotus eryngii]
MEVFNPNPVIFAPAKATSRRSKPRKPESFWDDEEADVEVDENTVEPIDQDEIFDLIRHISDPEHPNSLEELRVVSAPQISVSENRVIVEFTPTVPHCGMSTLIGLSIRVRLMQSLPPRFKVDIFVKPGSHQSEHAVNKQLNDKERVAAALENPALVVTVEKCLEKAESWGA